MSPLALFVYCFLLAQVLLLITKKAVYKKQNYKLPPSPFKLPFIGHLHQVASLSLHSLRTLSMKHGPLMLLHFGQVPTLIVSSAYMAQEIMKKQDDFFASRPSMKADDILGYGASNVSFAPYGEYWKHAKKLYIAHLLGPAKVRSFAQAREEEVCLVLEKIRHAQKMSNSVDLSEAFNLFAVGILGRSVSKHFSEKNLVLDLIEQGAALYFEFNFKDYFPTLHFLDIFLAFESKLRNISKKCDALFEAMISDYVNITQDDNKDGDFIDALLSLQESGQLEFELTKEQIKAFLLDMFAAGVHTTARTLEWAMVELMRDHKTMKQVQEEVRNISLGGRGIITNEDLKELTALKSVIKETLRLHPPGPVAVPHQSIEETHINGYTVPKGSRVLVNIWSINRDPKFWKNPDEFRPERFIGNRNTVDFWGNDFQFIPFGAGRRMCPGIHFALYNIEVLLANVLYHFDWELPDGMKADELDMGYAAGLTVKRNKILHLVPKELAHGLLNN